MNEYIKALKELYQKLEEDSRHWFISKVPVDQKTVEALKYAIEVLKMQALKEDDLK